MIINIEKMSKKDLEIIKESLSSDFDDFWNYNILNNELNNNTSHLFVAKNDQEIVGFIGVQFVLDEASITNIVTKKNYRNQGIGTILLDYLISYAKSNNMKTITLEVNEKNIFAIELYKKFGFNRTGLRKNYYNGVDNAVIMNLNI